MAGLLAVEMRCGVDFERRLFKNMAALPWHGFGTIVSTQRLPRGRDLILSTQRLLCGRDPISSTQRFPRGRDRMKFGRGDVDEMIFYGGDLMKNHDFQEGKMAVLQ